MSILSGGSSFTEVPGVNNAVQKLQELASRMRSTEFNFKDSDVSNVDHIIEALHELEVERAKLHDELEVETIEASKLRHRLQFLPDQVKKEITDAMNAARQSNADELARLQENLQGIDQNINYLEGRHRILENENAKLHPERDHLRQEHEEIIMQLNQRMAEKAGKQIMLNETRDTLRETNQKIVDIEDNIQQLKEDLIVERADIRMEKKRLKKAVFDTGLKTQEQKETNVAKKKELDELHEKVMDGQGKLDSLRKSIIRFETSRTRSENLEKNLSVHLEQELKQNNQLKKKGEYISGQIAKEEAAFEAKKQSMEAESEKMDKQYALEKQKNKELAAQRKVVSAELKSKTEIKMGFETRVKDTNAILQKSKKELAMKAEETGRLTQENIDLEARMEELTEGHKAIVTTVTKQIEETRDTLIKERKLRMELQGERDALQKDLGDFKAECNRYLAEMNKRIADGKKQHDELTREGTSLQKSIRENDEAIRRLKVESEELRKNYEQQKQHLEMEINNLQEEVMNMEKQLKEKQTLLTEKMPVFTDQEKFFEERTTDYDNMKKKIVAMKNEKMSLEDSVKQAEKHLQQMKKPKEELWYSLRRKRGEYLQLLHVQAEDVQEIEKKILDGGSKLKITLEENGRFNQAIDKLKSDLVDMKKHHAENKVIVEKLQHEYSDFKGDLTQKWANESTLEKNFADKDGLLVDELGLLLKNTQYRGDMIASISERLESELKVLAEFLHNVEQRRPKESRRGSRPKGEDGDKLPLSRPPTHLSPLPSKRSSSRAEKTPRKNQKNAKYTDSRPAESPNPDASADIVQNLAD